MSHILQFNSPFAFTADDTIPLTNFNQDSVFGLEDSNSHIIVPGTQLETFSTFSGGAAAADSSGSLSVHDLIRNAGIQLAPVPHPSSRAATPTSFAQPASSSQPASDLGIPAMYPHCTRVFSGDFDYNLEVNWNHCSAGQIYDICASPHMKCGQAASMAYLLKHAISTLTGELAVFCPNESKALKEATTKTVKLGPALRNMFENCCAGVGVLESLRRTLAKYTQSKANTIRWRPGVVAEENPNLLDQLRLASIMIDPRFVLFLIASIYIYYMNRCMELFGRMANPSQDRIAVEFPELRIAAVKQQLLQLLTDAYFNDMNFSPQHQPDIVSWFPGTNYDVSRPHERRTWIWIAQKLQFIKTGMTSLLANFMKSGNLAADADDHVRDLKFYTDFCHQQPLWFWVYMCWDHGRNVPAWNTALLPEDMRMDIGADDDVDNVQEESPPQADKRASSQTMVSSSAKKKKTTVAVAAVPEDALTSLIQVYSFDLLPCITHVTQVSHHLMTQHTQALSSQGSTSANSSPEKVRADKMEQLLGKVESLNKALKELPDRFHDDLRSEIDLTGEEYLRVARMSA